MTGVSLLSNVLGAKRVELLHELAPKVSRIALLMNPSNPNAADERADAQTGARVLGLETLVLNATNPREIDAAFDELLRAKADAFITATDPILLDRRQQNVSSLSAMRCRPCILCAVRGNRRASELRAEHHLDVPASRRIRGPNPQRCGPAEMPVMQPTKFEFVLNLKTAKMLGLDVPPTLLARADEVIE